MANWIGLTRILIACVCVWCGVSQTSGQTVQLPSVRTFSYTGAVRVPDRGTATLGGVRRSATGSPSRGLSRGLGQTASVSDALVSAQIIDLQERDRQLRGAVSGTPVQQGVSASGAAAAQTAAAPRRWSQTDYGKAFVRKARREHQQGNDSAAFESYRMAISLLNGELRDLASREFRRKFGAIASQVTTLR